MFLTDYFEIHQVHPSRFLSELKFLYFYFLISDSGSGPGARASFYFIFDFFLLFFFCVCVGFHSFKRWTSCCCCCFCHFFFLPCLPSSFSSADFDKFATGPRRQWRRRSTTTDVIDDRRLRRTSTSSSSSSSSSSSFSLSGNAASPIIFERKRMSFSALPVSWVGIFFFLNWSSNGLSYRKCWS